MVALREPSLDPCFWNERRSGWWWLCSGCSMEDINLPLLGIFSNTLPHALSAMIDNHIYWNLQPKIDPRRVTWRRVVDMNDRALRSI